jgi:CheY-like chemotaxis protein
VSDRTLKILVVDDNAAEVVLISEALSEHRINHTVTSCSDGEQALCTVAAELERFDVIILDLNMPKVGDWKCSCD